MTTDQFVVTYDGPALDDHEMDVDEFAQSLLALTRALRRTQDVLSPGATPVRLRVKAQEEGSFAVTLIAEIPNVVDRLVDVLTSRDVAGVLAAGGLTSMAFGAWKVIKNLGGRRVANQRTDGETIIWTLEDGEEIELDSGVQRILRDIEFRRASERFVEPLRRDGVTSMRINADAGQGEERISVTADEARSFQTPPSETIEAPDPVIADVVIKPLGVEFDWKQWRVTDGASVFPVAMADETFRHQVNDDGLRIGAGDSFRVTLRTEQTPKADGTLHVRRIVERVINHYPGGEQGELPLGDGTPVTPGA